MMQENKLIGKLKELRQIQPRKEWVSLTKTRILGQEPAYREQVSVSFFPYLKPVFAVVTAVFVFLGVFVGYGFVKNSLPGDLLYTIRKVVHEGQAVFIPENERTSFQLKLANERLEDLTKAPAKNLAPTINEFQANISKAAEDLTKTQNLNVQQIVSDTKKIKENKEKIESLGVVVGDTNELDSALLQLIERELKDLEVRTLTDAQKEIFVKAVEDFKAGNYPEALEEIWSISNRQQ